jgi:hypothetical protein
MLMRALSVHIAHEIAGAARIRHSLRPLNWGGRKEFLQTSGAMRRENAKLYLPSLRAKRSNPWRGRESKHGLLRFARNDGVDGPDGIYVPDW